MNLRVVVAQIVLGALSPLPFAFAQQAPTGTHTPPVVHTMSMWATTDGVWLGTLYAGPQTLRIQFHLQSDTSAGQNCAMDSIDQKAFGIPCSSIVNGSGLAIDVPSVAGKWVGHLSADGTSLTGTWTQVNTPLPLNMHRETAAIAPPAPVADTVESAMPPVAVADMKSVLDRDLAGALKSGDLAPATNGGVTIGLVQNGVRHIFSYGTAKDNSVFEIGSISKTFTGLLLAQMVEQGTVRLDEPVRELLPPGAVAKPASGAEITLVDLSDQHSGLPRMPDNFRPVDQTSPYADYDAKQLYAELAKHGVAKAADVQFAYSNLGVGLLGQALADRAKMSYSALLHQQITGPLNMHETAITLTPEMRARFIEGHDAEHHPAHEWDLDSLVGAGGIRSTAADMLTYLEAQLHPNKLPASVLATSEGKTLPAAIAKSQIVRGDVGQGMHIALNWFRIDATGSYWHNGGTGGYTSYALFNPEKDFALIVLSNTGPSDHTFADRLGQHIAQRFSGMPAISLAPEEHKD